MATKLKQELTFRDLVLFNIIAILGIRWIAVAAASGYSSITMWLLAFLCFLLPQVIAVRTLSIAYPQQGGIYVWTNKNFGNFHGFVCGWCYWGNNLTYFPSLLSFTCVVLLYSLGTKFLGLKENPYYVAFASIFILWLAIYVNMIGVRVGKWSQNIGALGSWITVVVLIVLGFWIMAKFGVANNFAITALLPSFDKLETITIFSYLCFAFAGFELAPVMVEEVKNLHMLIKAIVVATAILTLLYILGTISILTALPLNEIGLIDGPLQALQALTQKLGMEYVVYVLAVCIAIGGFGGVGAWLAGCARIPYAMGLDKYMPQAMSKIHPTWQTPYIALIVQGIAATIFILISLLGSVSPQAKVVEHAYLFLVDATLIVYFIPYIYMFLAYFKVQQNWYHHALAILGLITTIGAIALSCIPPQKAHPLYYVLKLLGSIIVFIAIGIVFYIKGSFRKNQETTA